MDLPPDSAGDGDRRPDHRADRQNPGSDCYVIGYDFIGIRTTEYTLIRHSDQVGRYGIGALQQVLTAYNNLFIWLGTTMHIDRIT